MTTINMVDPELRPLLEQFPELRLSTETLPQIRAMLAEIDEQQRPHQADILGVSVSEQTVPGPEGAPDVRVLLYRPLDATTTLPALLWIHGGGYVLGNADGDDLQVKRIVTQANCFVVSVDYRLAPEAPFPAAVEDCYAALRWLHREAASLDVDPTRLAIGGASAGGGLTAALGLLTRDRGEVPLAFQLLIYPMIDDRVAVSADPHPHTGEFIWTAEANHFGWTALLGQEPGSPGVSPYAAAARAESLAGLPPTFINVGALDLFLEEDIEYARRLMREGVPTELHVYPAAYHGFDMLATASVSQAFIRDYIAALRRALYPAG